MKSYKYLIVGYVIIAASIISCKNDRTAVPISITKTNPEGSIILTDSLVYGIVTHTSQDADPLENEEFKTFLQENLINYIFDQLYAENLKAFDFFSGKELTIKEIKKIEKTEGFSRSRVGKVQFNEQWYFDKNGVLNKRVNSMTFGVEHYSNQGTFLNYNALFTINFKRNVQ